MVGDVRPQDQTEDELIDDAECLGDLRAIPGEPPHAEKRSLVFTFCFPPQDYKFAVGDDCLCAHTLERAGKITDIDAAAGIVRIKRGTGLNPLPAALSVIPTPPFDTSLLRDAVYRFAGSIIAKDWKYQAVP